MSSSGPDKRGVGMYRIKYSCINTIGRVRESNQDNFYCEGRYRFGKEKLNDICADGEIVSSDNRILAVLDGMGGEACGDKAALIAAAGIDDFDRASGNGRAVLYDMSVRLNSLVCQYAEFNRIGSMGSTLAAIRFSDDSVCLCNLGDSRIFRITSEGIRCISTDHIIPDYPLRKAPLTQFLGLPEGDCIIEPHIAEEKPLPGTAYLLCSDGITDMLSIEEIFETVKNEEDVSIACKLLADKALEAGGYDNITALLCKL